jgi:iron complex outermembrane receptor protein
MFTLRAKKYSCASLCVIALLVFAPTLSWAQAQTQLTNFDSLYLDLDLVEIEGVQSSGKETLSKIESVNVEELDRSAEASRILALRKQLGVDLVTRGGGAIKPVIRGLSGMRVATLYRGATIESQSWGASHGIYIPEQGVSRVEIIRGPNALAISPDAIGGAINFLAEPALPRIGRENTISLRGFSATQGFSSSLKTKKKSEHSYHTFSGGYNSHQNYVQPDGEEVNNSWYNQFFGQGQFGYIYDWGVIDGAYASSYNNAGIIGEDGWQQSGDHLITVSSSYNMGQINMNHILSYQLNHRKEFENADDQGGEDGNPAQLDMSARALRYSVIAKPKYENSTAYSWRAGLQGKLLTNENAENALEILIENAEQTEYGAFLSPSYTSEKFELLSTVRVDRRDVVWSNRKDFNYISYSVGGKYAIGKNIDLLASFTNAGRAPSFAELFSEGLHNSAYRYELGDENLGVERSRNVEVNLLTSLAKFEVELNVFKNYIEDFIHIRNTGAAVGMFDVFEYYSTNARLTGAEFGANYSVNDKFNLNLNASYVEGIDLVTNHLLPLIPPFTINAVSEYSTEDLFVSANLEYTQAFTLLHLSSEYKMSEKFKVGLSVHNAFNTEYIPVLSLLGNLNIPEPGRNFSARLAYIF